MAKVELPDHLTAGFVPGMLGRRPERKKETPKAGAFRSVFRTAERAEATPAAAGEPYSEAEVSELMDGIHEAGDLLRRDQNAENVRVYKKAVRDFMHYVVERAFAVEERSSGRNILKRKKFTTVAVIDEKLERLAAEVLSAQRDRLDILKRMDEIHGLLVDLLR